jgi:hypothetical protein
MARECAAVCVAVFAIALVPGCSLILNFSDKDAPHDAPFDTPWTSAECMYGEPNQTPQTAFMITPGTDTGPAAICPGNTGSYYKFAVPSTATTVTVSITFASSIGDLCLILDDALGNELASSRGFGNGQQIVCPGFSPPCEALAAGNYLFEVEPATIGTTNYYSFSVAIAQ